MTLPAHHRKRVRHFDLPGHVHELTFSCYQRQPLLTDDRFCALLSTAIERACQRHNYRLASFVFMPEHVHLMVWPGESASPIASLLRAIKRPSSFRIKLLLREAPTNPYSTNSPFGNAPVSPPFAFGKKVLGTIAT